MASGFGTQFPFVFGYSEDEELPVPGEPGDTDDPIAPVQVTIYSTIAKAKLPEQYQ